MKMSHRPCGRNLRWLLLMWFIVLGPSVVGAEPRFITPKAISTNQIGIATNSFDADALALILLLEGWHDATLEECEERLSRMFLSHMLVHFPLLSQAEMDLLNRDFKPRIVEAVRLRAATALRGLFSHEELRELIAFFQTPLGRKYAASYPRLMERMADDLNHRILRRELVARLREKFPDAQ